MTRDYEIIKDENRSLLSQWSALPFTLPIRIFEDANNRLKGEMEKSQQSFEREQAETEKKQKKVVVDSLTLILTIRLAPSLPQSPRLSFFFCLTLSCSVSDGGGDEVHHCDLRGQRAEVARAADRSRASSSSSPPHCPDRFHSLLLVSFSPPLPRPSSPPELDSPLADLKKKAKKFRGLASKFKEKFRSKFAVAVQQLQAQEAIISQLRQEAQEAEDKGQKEVVREEWKREM